MWKLFHIATRPRAITLIVRTGYWSAPYPPCVVRTQVRMAPSASDRTDVGLASKWGVSGALGFGTLSGSQPAARTRATIRPATPGIRLLKLIALVSSEVQVAG